jgi:hypothetical protein
MVINPVFSENLKDDPLVTRSYLENFYEWKKAVFTEGQSFSLNEGSMMVVLKGKVEAVGMEEEVIINLTTGESLKNGDILPFNNLLIAPDSQGIGIKFLSDTTMLILGLKKK